MKTIKNIYHLFFAAIVLASCGQKTETAENKEATNEFEVVLTENQLKNSKIELGTLDQKPVSNTIKVNGKITLAPEAIATISMPLGGYVKAIKVMQGMNVRKGQVLAVVEDPQYVQLQQDYLTTRQQLTFANKDFNRQKELNASKAVSDKTYEMAQSELAKQKITLKSLEEKLKLIGVNPSTLTANNISKSVSIYSPINGLVSKVEINLGKYVNASDMLFEVINNQHMFLKLNVYDKDASNLYIGQKVTAFSNNTSDSYNTSILYVNRNINEENAVEVITKINNVNGKLIPGNYMNAVIESQNNNAFVLNNEAIVNFEDKNYVFVSDNNTTFRMIEVEVGTKMKDYTEIKNSSVLSNKKVVVKDAYTLLMVLKNKEE
ncbi:efflux RND transporter periplasmic adaptor subunit [Flavobacterium luminosum]|uniref:Efflux RND transporter periplasmic adaptor subunit n=1 Tax=Flavobacterium luminosum TaxID=2949086 RepID=A0ABT0TQ62_9FLAO|nr:efflux RND transporter periplasmic adaptor subunit [Flavobacterium sp. HXWNR70]MCL9809630.1 efflux RND transporter periplasmic adaptor subunit [Flavobacterium sp. HXWNR70]